MKYIVVDAFVVELTNVKKTQKFWEKVAGKCTGFFSLEIRVGYIANKYEVGLYRGLYMALRGIREHFQIWGLPGSGGDHFYSIELFCFILD